VNRGDVDEVEGRRKVCTEERGGDAKIRKVRDHVDRKGKRPRNEAM